jgi:hypothetical protein
LHDAVSAGEIDSATADHVAAHVNEAGLEDEDGLDVIDSDGTIGHFHDHLQEALAQKDDAESALELGQVLTLGGLGCSLNVSPLSSGDLAVGFDNCQTPVQELQLRLGFAPARYTNGFIGQGSQTTGTMPCTLQGMVLDCKPNQPVKAPQYLFVAFGPSPSTITTNDALAFGTDGHTQVEPFTVGTAPGMTDLRVSAHLSLDTRLGFFDPPGRISPRLGLGLQYVYSAEVENVGTGTATNAKLQLDFGPSFHVTRVFPSSCVVSPTGVTCPMGTLPPAYGGSISVTGTAVGTGPLTFGGSITSDATEPSPDPDPNTVGMGATVYGVAIAPIDSIARAITLGRPGTIAGRGFPGAPTFQPTLERVTKVELAFLKTTNTGGKCDWLTASGTFKAVPLHTGGCDKGVWLPAVGTSEWTFPLRYELPKGKYVVLARATNGAGIVGNLFGPTFKNELKLTVRQRF